MSGSLSLSSVYHGNAGANKNRHTWSGTAASKQPRQHEQEPLFNSTYFSSCWSTKIAHALLYSIKLCILVTDVIMIIITVRHYHPHHHLPSHTTTYHHHRRHHHHQHQHHRYRHHQTWSSILSPSSLSSSSSASASSSLSHSPPPPPPALKVTWDNPMHPSEIVPVCVSNFFSAVRWRKLPGFHNYIDNQIPIYFRIRQIELRKTQPWKLKPNAQSRALISLASMFGVVVLKMYPLFHHAGTASRAFVTAPASCSLQWRAQWQTGLLVEL